MEKVAIDGVAPAESNSPADVVRLLSPALGTNALAMNYFEVDPSESLGFAYHRHLDQEELFYVLRGMMTFETESGNVEVAADEVIRFPPGEFQLGRNLGEERAHVLAIGVPPTSTDVEYRRYCPTCEEETIQVPEVVEHRNTILVHCDACDETVEEISLAE